MISTTSNLAYNLVALRQGMATAAQVVWISDGARSFWRLYQECFASGCNWSLRFLSCRPTPMASCKRLSRRQGKLAHLSSGLPECAINGCVAKIFSNASDRVIHIYFNTVGSASLIFCNTTTQTDLRCLCHFTVEFRGCFEIGHCTPHSSYISILPETRLVVSTTNLKPV